MNRLIKKHILIIITASYCFSGCDKLELKQACTIPYIDFVAYNVNPTTLQVGFRSITSYNGNISSYMWDFGDGTTFNGQTPPIHTYPALSNTSPSKTYRIKFTVANECGSSYWTKDIVVGPCLANVRFVTSITGNTVTFTNQSTSVTASSYNWNFGDGTSLTTSSTTFSHAYVNSGTYQVVLKATNTCGDNFYTLPVTVCNTVGPIGPLNYTSDDLTFTSIGTVSVLNATSYLWNFGDGTTSNLQNPGTKVYTNPGQYTWTLTASNGCSSATTSLTLTAPRINNSTNAPTSNFVAVSAVTTSQIYYIGSNANFYKYDGSNAWINYGVIPITLDANTRLVRDPIANVWVYGTGGIAKWTGSTWTFFSSLSLGYPTAAVIKDIDFDNSNNLWSTSGTQIRLGTLLKVSTSTSVTSIKYAAATNTLWYTLAGNSPLFGYSVASSTLFSRTVSNLSTNSSNIEVDSLTDNLYISSNNGIVRCDPNGFYTTYYSSANTAYLNMAPIKIQFDNRGYMWVLESIGGDFIRMSKSISVPDSKLYSTVPNINSINDFSIVRISGTEDIFLAKYQTNAAIRIY